MSSKTEKPRRPKPPVQHLSPEDRAFMALLEQKRGELRQSKNSFARHTLKISNGTYSQLLGDVYPGNSSAMVAKLRAAYETFRDVDSLAVVETRTDDQGEFFETSTLLAVKKGLAAAARRDDELRMVIFLAEAGGGKDTAIRYAAASMDEISRPERPFTFVTIEARESWRKSYFAAVCDILYAVAGVDAGNMSCRAAENLLISALRAKRVLLAVNEGNYFGPHTFNLFKFLINQTPIVILLCAIPSIFQRLKLKSWDEAKQVIRRSYVTITAPDLTVKDVRPFIAHLDFQAQDAAAAAIAVNANQFGAFGFVKRVVEEFEDAAGAIPPEALERACAKVHAFFQQRAAMVRK